MNRNVSGIRATWMEAAAQLVNQQQLDAVDGRIDGVVDDINNVGAVVDDYGPQITDLVTNRVLPWAVPTISPLSQTINRRADASFQLSDLSTPVLTGTTSTATSYPEHNHTVALESSRMFRSGALKGQGFLAFITPAITREYEQLNFMLGEGTTTPAQLDVAIYVVDPETRVLSRQVLETNVAAALPLGEAVVTVPFPKWVAVQGSYIAVAFLWHGDGDTRHILGVGDATRPLPTEIIFPAKISARLNIFAMTSLPASIDGTTQVDFQYWYTPYAELSEKIGTIIRSFTENWPDTGGEAPRPWAPITSTGISSSGGFTAAPGFGTRVSIYDTPLATDRVRVRGSVHRVFTNNFRRSTLIVRSTNNARSGVGVSVINLGSGNGRYELIEWNDRDASSSWDDRTVVRTIGVVPVEGDQIEVDYIDGVVDVRINGVGHVVGQLVGGPSGQGSRFVGIQNERTGNTLTAYPSPSLGPWSARDLPQSEGGEDAPPPGEGGD